MLPSEFVTQFVDCLYEFVLDGDYKYPDDYPEEGQSITIKGVFNTYNEYGFNYAQLQNATMVVNS